MKTRKLMAILVAVAMIVTMLPMVAFAEPSNEKDIVSFTLTQETGPATIDTTNHTVAIEVAHGTNVTALTPTIVVSAEASVNPATGTAQNFTSPVTYVVTAEDGTAQNWVVTVSVAAGQASPIRSSVAVSPSTRAADFAEEATITVRLRDSNGFATNDVGSAAGVWVWAERAGSLSTRDTITGGAGVAGAKWIDAKTIVNGTFTATIKSAFPGEAQIYVGFGAKDAETPSQFSAEGMIAQSAKVTFQEGTIEEDEATIVWDTANPNSAQQTYQVGTTALRATVTVRDGNGRPMADVPVTVNSTRGSVDNVYIAGSGKTNSNGEVTLRFSSNTATPSNVPAELRVYADGVKVGPTVEMTVIGDTPARIELESGGTGTLARNEEARIRFRAFDANGNHAKSVSLDDFEIEVSAPSGSSREIDSPVRFGSVTSGHLGYSSGNAPQYDVNADGRLQFYFRPDRDGEYTITVTYAGTNVSASTTFDSTRQGSITSMTASYDTTKLSHGSSSVAPSVKYLDAAGVARDMNSSDSVTYTSSNASLATVNSSGVVTATRNDERTGTVVITVVDSAKGLVAESDPIEVVGIPATVQLSSDGAEVGSAATINATVVDANGKATSFDDIASNSDIRVTIVSKPAGANVTYTLPGKAALRDTGEATFTVRSDKAGEVDVRLMVEGTVDSTLVASAYNVVGGVKVNFGAPAAEKPGANSVVLTIGSNVAVVDGAVEMFDAPAFIEGGRTYVPFRFLAEAFGAEVDWAPKDGLTETVTLTRDDMTVVIGIGDSFLTVTRDGEDEVITSDGAAQVKNGRTFLPFRAIAEAFGANVEFGTNAEGFTTWVSFTQE